MLTGSHAWDKTGDTPPMWINNHLTDMDIIWQDQTSYNSVIAVLTCKSLNLQKLSKKEINLSEAVGFNTANFTIFQPFFRGS